MKIFIDTLNPDQINEAQDLGAMGGLATNPSLMAKEGITGNENILQHCLNTCGIWDDRSTFIYRRTIKNPLTDSG